MTPLRRLLPRLVAMVLTALVLAWSFAEFGPSADPAPSSGNMKTALVLSGAAATPLVGPLLNRLLDARRN